MDLDKGRLETIWGGVVRAVLLVVVLVRSPLTGITRSLWSGDLHKDRSIRGYRAIRLGIR